MKTFYANFGIAVIWMVVWKDSSVPAFGAGFGAGFVLLSLWSFARDSGRYPRRWLAFVRFLGIFVWEFCTANLGVARIVLFERTEDLQPDFIEYDVAGMHSNEIVMLSYCITLTPGTTAVSVSEDLRTLVIHALNAQSPEEVRNQIDRRLRKPILNLTRI